MRQTKAVSTLLAITPGEPAGIGPDLCLQHLGGLPAGIHPVLIADPELLEARARQLGVGFRWQEFRAGTPPQADIVDVLPVALGRPARCGSPDTGNAAYVLRTLDAAIQGCQRGEFAAMVTGPVQKSTINEAGIAFSGHTEYLAAAAGCSRVVMMLATTGLRVALVTTHLPLARVPEHITQDNLVATVEILHRDLQRRFGIKAPRILVCGLNPHAGENGHLGREEIDIITPALDHCRRQGIQLIGPLPADTLFTPKYLDKADAVLAMYHDQGLPVLKFKGFGRAANITLGLPFIRTSVDHGTALDLAGSGKADGGSLLTAIHCAVDMARSTSV